MTVLKLVEVIESTGKDDSFPPEHMLYKNPKKWLCSTKEKNLMISATFRLAGLSYINRFDIGNAGSAEVSVLVARYGSRDFKQLLPTTVLRSEEECRNNTNQTGVRMFTNNQMHKETRHDMWDVVRVICYQPFRRSASEQFGLHLIALNGKSESCERSMLSSAASLQKFKESAIRSSSSSKLDVHHSPSLTRANKMLLASKSLPSSPEMRGYGDIFKVTVMSFLDSKNIGDRSAMDLRQQYEHHQGRALSTIEKRIFMQIFRDYTSSINSSLPSGILTPRIINRQTSPSLVSKKIQDTKLSLFKPQLDDALSAVCRENTQTVYRAEVVHNHSIKNGSVAFMGACGKENTPFMLQKCSRSNEDVIAIDESKPTSSPIKKVGCSDRKLCLDPLKSPRESWKGRNDVDKCHSDQCSPDSWLKRKSDPSEKSQPLNKKRPREAACVENSNGDSTFINKVTPSGGWVLNKTGLYKKSISPTQLKKDEPLQFPFRVSPPPPTSRPASPVSLVDDIDQPSTSSRETVAERNIRLEMERRLAERSPPERVVQRTSSGKVKGTYCTKGMNTNDSPLRRLSICDETYEVDPVYARRKLRFARHNNIGESESMAECPVCSGFFEDIYRHLEDCFPIKKPDESENDDEMACPICGLWVSKDTVAAHADECAQKRYGA